MTDHYSPFKGMNGGAQLLSLLIITFFGTIIGGFVVYLLIKNPWQSALALQLSQVIQSVFIFLIPSLIFANYFQHKGTKSYLKIKHINYPLLILFIIVLILFIQPIVQLIADYNSRIVFPPTLEGLKNWLAMNQKNAEQGIDLMMANNSVFNYILNIIVIAGIAGIVEEFFFRGCLQQVIKKIVKNNHATVWITALLFSIAHFEFDGFISRILLGALLGYIFLWTGNIWLSVIAHVFHNTINVVLMEIFHRYKDYQNLKFLDISHHVLIVVVTFIVFLVVFYFFRKQILKSRKWIPIHTD